VFVIIFVELIMLCLGGLVSELVEVRDEVAFIDAVWLVDE